MSGRQSRDKGACTERAIPQLLQAQDTAAMKISGPCKPGADISVPLLGVDRAVEVRCRSARFSQPSDWLSDIVIVKAERQEPLVVLRMSLAAEVARGAA